MPPITDPARKIPEMLSPFVLVFIVFNSCTHEPDYLNEFNDTICFSSQVLPLLQNTCGTSGCHDASTASGGFVPANYENIVRFVKAGSPRESKLYVVTSNIRGEHLMPPENPLSARGLKIIKLVQICSELL